MQIFYKNEDGVLLYKECRDGRFVPSAGDDVIICHLEGKKDTERMRVKVLKRVWIMKLDGTLDIEFTVRARSDEKE